MEDDTGDASRSFFSIPLMSEVTIYHVSFGFLKTIVLGSCSNFRIGWVSQFWT